MTHAATTLGAMTGSVMWRNVCHELAPSIRAARPRSRGTARSAPRNSTPSSGIARQITATPRATRDPVALSSASVGSPSARSASFTSPVFGSNCIRQKIPLATGATAQGTTRNSHSGGRGPDARARDEQRRTQRDGHGDEGHEQ